MKAHIRLATALAAIATATAAQAQVFVSATTSIPTALGSVTAGQHYTVTATGTANLATTINGGLGLPFDANGIPTIPFAAPYNAFNPSGLDFDPSQGASVHGIGGAGVLYGALLGTFTATPTVPADYFLIGSSLNFTAGSNGTLYGVVNDCPNCYSDNGGGFTATLALATGLPVGGVPEPRSWAMMLIGFGAIGFAMRRHGHTELTVSRIA